MPWFAIVRKSDGELVSLGTSVADPLDARLEAIDVGPDRPAGRWNRQTRAFEPIPDTPDEELRRKAARIRGGAAEVFTPQEQAQLLARLVGPPNQ